MAHSVRKYLFNVNYQKGTRILITLRIYELKPHGTTTPWSIGGSERRIGAKYLHLTPPRQSTNLHNSLFSLLFIMYLEYGSERYQNPIPVEWGPGKTPQGRSRQDAAVLQPLQATKMSSISCIQRDAAIIEN